MDQKNINLPHFFSASAICTIYFFVGVMYNYISIFEVSFVNGQKKKFLLGVILQKIMITKAGLGEMRSKPRVFII